ncbi:MAG: hypothetical protein AAF627_08880 [Myxococcota bacterium]
MKADSIRKQVVQAAFLLWIPSVLIPCAYLLAGHLLTLPEPNDEQLEIALHELLGHAAPTELDWVAIHVLYAECGCSKRVMQRLSARSPSADVEERVWIIDARPEDLSVLQEAGFVARAMDRRELYETFHIEAAPLLLLATARGELRYVGGYTDRKRGPDIRDLELMAAVRHGHRPQGLPLFGCATSARLQAQVDPLGLK